MPKLKEIALDIVKFGRTHDEEATRFLKSNEQRLNENFRRLKEATEEIMADFTDVYSKSEVDTLLSAKADVITTYGDLSQTGHTLKNEPASVSVPTATWKTVASITFPQGTWLVTGTVRYASNATGYRWAKIGNTSDDSGQWGIASNDTQNAVDGDYTFCRATFILEATSSETYYLKAYQNSGSSLTTYGRMYAVRIA